LRSAMLDTCLRLTRFRRKLSLQSSQKFIHAHVFGNLSVSR
jgi:hypothetical protein